MSKQIDRLDITEQLYIYLQDNSKRWYARYSVVSGKWISASTKLTDKEQAAEKAREIFYEAKIKAKHGLPSDSRKFKYVAELAIKRMEDELSAGTGAANYAQYIAILNNYYVPYFSRHVISSIDKDKLLDFEKWREEKMGKKPKKNTVGQHNVALNRVFDEAHLRGWISSLQIPKLANNGEEGTRVTAFTQEEFGQLIMAIPAWIEDAHTAKTRMIRELLYYYILFAVYTGMRPGAEIEALTWGDLITKRKNKKEYLLATVTKGKTIKKTGPRTVVCQEGAVNAIEHLKKAFPNAQKTDLIFRLADGTTTGQLTKAFTNLLNKTGLKSSKFGERRLYSLRHTYITWQLKEKRNINVLATQCGNSAAIIERNYKHLVPEMHVEELSAHPTDGLTDIAYEMADTNKTAVVELKDIKL